MSGLPPLPCLDQFILKPSYVKLDELFNHGLGSMTLKVFIFWSAAFILLGS